MQLDWNSHFILNIYGMCNSGKSHSLKALIYSASSKKEFDHMLLFTNTSFNNQYDYIPKDYIHPSYDERILGNYMELQKQLISKGKKTKGLIVFDDVLGQSEFGTKHFLTLITQFRQFKLSVIICSQSISKIPLQIRDLAQYSAIFRYESERAIKNAYESFGVLFNNWHEYKEYLINSTGNHKFLFYDKSLSTEGIDKAYKSLKAPAIIPEFKLKF